MKPEPRRPQMARRPLVILPNGRAIFPEDVQPMRLARAAGLAIAGLILLGSAVAFLVLIG